MKRPTPRTRRSDKFETKADVRFTDAIVSYEVPKKKFSVHDLKQIEPMTRNQEKVFDLFEEDYNLFLSGSAGTGKSFLGISLAMKEILSGNSPYRKLVILRSPSQIADLGYLPGTQEEKEAVYETTYHQLFDDIFKKKNQYAVAKDSGLVEFMTTAFIRGITLKDSIIVFDEAQNNDYSAFSSVVTRVGENSKIIICGDIRQSDIQRKRGISGFNQMLEVTKMMPSFRNIEFTMDDCVRSGIAREFLIAEDRYEKILESRKFDK